MPFGKYKGRLIADLPGNYLTWFAREGFPPGEIGRLLAPDARNRPQRPEGAAEPAATPAAGLNSSLFLRCSIK